MATKQTSEHDLENQQEESQQAAEAEEQAQGNAEDGTESAGSGASYQSAASGVSTPQQSARRRVATGGAGTQDSEESSVCSGGSGTESQQDGATGGGSGTELQQGGATGGGSGTELQQGGGSGTESQQGGATGGGTGGIIKRPLVKWPSGTELQQGGATRQLSEDSAASTGFAVDELQLLGAVGGTSSRDSKSSGSAYSTCLGDSQETALVCDSSSRTSLESGVAGGVSNSPDTQESPDTGTEAFEDVVPSGAVGRSTRQSRVQFRDSADETAQEADELEGSSDQCFSKCARICDYLRPWSRRIRNSKIFMVLKMILLIIPISAFCMGLKYANHCPLGNELPILVMLSGVSGVILLTSCLTLASRHVLCPSLDTNYFRALLISSGVMLVVVFSAGMESTYKMVPSFDPSKPEYCDKVFYYYAYYTNFVVVGIAVLSFFIYVPSFNENEDYELL